MATQKTELYDEDFYQWSREQAAALRRLSAERWNGLLDLEHLAEEVEELASEVRNAARSHLRRLIEHMLKLEYSPAPEPRRGWIESIDDARVEIEQRLPPGRFAVPERPSPWKASPVPPILCPRRASIRAQLRSLV